MKRISSFIAQRKHLWRKKRISEMANEIYQIKEHDGVLWITYDGVRVIPEGLLSDDAISVVVELRDRYVKERI